MPRQTRKESLSETVKRLGITYAHYFNKKYERNGHLFQDRFRSEPVDSIEYFVVLLRYINQNQVKAGIVTNVADYPWSSWAEYVRPSTAANPICSLASVFKRIPKADLIELVETPVEEYGGIIDMENDVVVKVTDDALRQYLNERHGIANPLAIQSLEKVRRNEVLRSLKAQGAGIRQLARLTGVSFGVIQKLREK